MLISDQNELLIMCGFPASGKSTFMKIFVDSENRVFVSYDDIRREMFGQQFYYPCEPFVNAIGESMVRLLLKQGQTVYLDTTALTLSLRAKWIKIAKECGATPSIIWMNTPLDICIERDSKREVGKHVGKEVFDGMAKIFEMPTEAECKIIMVHPSSYTI